MTDWQLVDISDDKPESLVKDLEDLDYGGLESDVQNLHSNFWNEAEHLAEVEDRHMQVLVSSGMIPEDHIASTEPSRKLDWFVKELNGRINPDGLSIPLKGLEIDDIEIYQKTSDDETVIKLNLTSLRTMSTITKANIIATTKLSWKLSVISNMYTYLS